MKTKKPLTIGQARNQLGFTYYQMRQLVDQGYIKPEMILPSGRMLFSRESIEGYRNQYKAAAITLYL